MFGLKVVPLQLHCLVLSFCHNQKVLSWYLHQPETHQLSLYCAKVPIKVKVKLK